MQIFYDKDLSIIEDRDKYIIYSPSNHKWLKINLNMKELIEQIIKNQGIIDYETISEHFCKKYNVGLSKEMIDKQINRLCRTSIFFYQLQDIMESEKSALEDYKLSKDHKIEIVYLHPTLRCNFKCKYCYNKSLLQTKQKELNTQQWYGIIDKLKEKNVKLYVFTGGEPLLRKDILELIKYTKEENNKVQLLSNGSLLYSHCEELLPYVDKFVISLDSVDKNINAINRSDHGYDSIIDSIKFFSKYAKEKLLIRCVITKDNSKGVQEFAKDIHDQYGIRVIFTRFIPNNIEEIELIPDLPNLELEIEAMPKINSSIKILRCGASSNIIAIDPQGGVYPCQNLLLSEFKITNIMEESWYAQLRNSNIHEVFRNLYVRDIEKCGECSYRYLCGGGCPAIAYKVFGKVDHHLSFLCSTLKEEAIMRLRLADVDWKEIV